MLGNEIKKNLYFKYGVSLLVALVISLFFSHTIFNDIFASPAKEARLVIQQQPSEISNQVDQI